MSSQFCHGDSTCQRSPARVAAIVMKETVDTQKACARAPVQVDVCNAAQRHSNSMLSQLGVAKAARLRGTNCIGQVGIFFHNISRSVCFALVLMSASSNDMWQSRTGRFISAPQFLTCTGLDPPVTRCSDRSICGKRECKARLKSGETTGVAPLPMAEQHVMWVAAKICYYQQTQLFTGTTLALFPSTADSQIGGLPPSHLTPYPPT